jgi:hypothetical protein
MTMADLPERYLHAVRRALPAAKADDIVAELRDVLATQREDREETLGRPLTEDETAAMLKEFGHPLVVAARYRPQQWLIGPDVFPFYWFVMRIVVLVIVGVDVATAIARVLFTHQSPFQVFAQSWGSLCMSLLINVGVLTVIFAIMERAGFPADHVKQWKPEQLPPADDARKSVWESAFEVGAGVVVILWWVGLIHFPWANANSEFRMEPAPIFTQLYWPVLALLVVRLIENLVDWVQPGRRLLRGMLSVATTIVGLALVAALYRAGPPWAVVVPLSMPAAQAADMAASVNLALKIAIVAVGAIWAWQGVQTIWRLARRQSART